MGAGQSGGLEISGSTMGYQVLRVYPNSPGSRAGLKAYFDFIVAIGNTRFNKDSGSFREILKASVDQKLKMVVYNTRTKRVREVDIVPSTSWGGSGLLGVSIKHSSFDRADERVWHVVEVESKSPAEQAGFQPTQDYVIGSDSILQENDDLYNLIEAHDGKALKLFVYNALSDNCREVVCYPNSRWGGKGYLGCEFGHGLLHRIPYAGADEGGDVQDNVRASLIRNEQSAGTLEHDLNPPLAKTNNHAPQAVTFSSLQNQMVPPQMPRLPNTQPGHQLLQQALFQDVKPVQEDKQLVQPHPIQQQQQNIQPPQSLATPPQQQQSIQPPHNPYSQQQHQAQQQVYPPQLYQEQKPVQSLQQQQTNEQQQEAMSGVPFPYNPYTQQQPVYQNHLYQQPSQQLPQPPYLPQQAYHQQQQAYQPQQQPPEQFQPPQQQLYQQDDIRQPYHQEQPPEQFQPPPPPPPQPQSNQREPYQQ